MKIAIIGSQTGNGHISVLEALRSEFDKRDNIVDCYPTFYEKLMLSNKILSDFYNFLLANSISLCNIYCEFTNISRYDLSDEFYQGIYDKLSEFLIKNEYDILISVTHTINPAIVRILRELNMEKKIKFIVVIPDPFVPIAPGYAIPGCYKYYCATNDVKFLLHKSGIDLSRIKVFGYPINQKFAYANPKKDHKRSILLNCGSQGAIYYFKFLKQICENTNDISIEMICGKNRILYNQSKKYVDDNNLNNRVKVYPFVTDMYTKLYSANLVITKPGANSIFEALNCRTPVIIDATEGFIFQERGVKDFLKQYKIGEILYEKENLVSTIEYCLNKDHYENYIKQIEKVSYKNGTVKIVKDILDY